MKSPDFISEENTHLIKFHKIVQESIEAEELIIYNLLHPPTETLSEGQKISDKVAKFGGSTMASAVARAHMGSGALPPVGSRGKASDQGTFIP